TGCLIDRVREFEIDAALVATPPDASMLTDEFDSVPVFDEQLVMVTPRGHRAIRAANDVALSTLVAFERGCAYRGYIERWYAQHGLRPARTLELGSYHAIVACVAAGAGVAVAPRSVLELLPGGAREVAIHAIGPLGVVPTLLIWRRGHDSAALHALRDALLGDAHAAADTNEHGERADDGEARDAR
ncbi:LysR family transcriptional regulator, partial [Bacillus pumilus]